MSTVARARALRLRARGSRVFFFLFGVGCSGELGCWLGWCWPLLLLLRVRFFTSRDMHG